MTKKWIALALASMCMGLVSCGSREETSSDTGNASNNGSTASSTTSGNATESTPDETNPTAWSESDLKDMSKYLNGYTCLPFPRALLTPTSTPAERMKTENALLPMMGNAAICQKAMGNN